MVASRLYLSFSDPTWPIGRLKFEGCQPSPSEETSSTHRHGFEKRLSRPVPHSGEKPMVDVSVISPERKAVFLLEGSESKSSGNSWEDHFNQAGFPRQGQKLVDSARNIWNKFLCMEFSQDCKSQNPRVHHNLPFWGIPPFFKPNPKRVFTSLHPPKTPGAQEPQMALAEVGPRATTPHRVMTVALMAATEFVANP